MINKYKLVYSEQCFNCPPVRKYLSEIELNGEIINASQEEGLEIARNMNVQKVPTVIFFKDDVEISRAYSIDDCKTQINKNAQH